MEWGDGDVLIEDGMDEWEEERQKEREGGKGKGKNATEPYGCVPCHAE
jgi:hypothetical protein